MLTFDRRALSLSLPLKAPRLAFLLSSLHQRHSNLSPCTLACHVTTGCPARGDKIASKHTFLFPRGHENGGRFCIEDAEFVSTERASTRRPILPSRELVSNQRIVYRSWLTPTRNVLPIIVLVAVDAVDEIYTRSGFRAFQCGTRNDSREHSSTARHVSTAERQNEMAILDAKS